MNTNTRRFIEECDYLLELISRNGSKEVPPSMIPDYFRTQASAARKSHYYTLAHTLEWCAEHWYEGNVGEMSVALETHRDELGAREQALGGA